EDARFNFYFGGVKTTSETEIFFQDMTWEEIRDDTPHLSTDVGNIILNGNKAAFKRWTKEDLKNQDDFWFDLTACQLWFYSDKNPAEKYTEIEAALRNHGVNLSGCGYAVFDGLDVRYAAAHGFGGSGNHHLIIRNCDISWIGGGDQYLEGGDGRRVRFGNGIEFWANAHDQLVENNHLWEIYDAALTNQGSGENRQINITYRNNRIETSEYSFEFWNRGPESETRDILFEGNVCTDAGYGWGHVQRPDKNGRHLMFYHNSSKTSGVVIRNNVFRNATDSLIRLENDWTAGLTFENNTWEQKPGLPCFLWLKQNYGEEGLSTIPGLQ
ncbi:MAG: right-handed parallel beta-helix repeat-containing protein, partial [Thermoguttaceae bacterium]|nr:right-handed parallel beta-helix repeat-containing protein [Thermoguttaceae bacterium]